MLLALTAGLCAYNPRQVLSGRLPRAIPLA